MSKPQPIDIWRDERGNCVINIQSEVLDAQIDRVPTVLEDGDLSDSKAKTICVLDLTQLRQCSATGLMGLTNLIWHLKLPDTRIIGLISSGEVFYLVRGSVLSQVVETLPLLPDDRILSMEPAAKLQLAVQLADGKQCANPEWINRPFHIDPGNALNHIVG